jgi:hypothetical protein
MEQMERTEGEKKGLKRKTPEDTPQDEKRSI